MKHRPALAILVLTVLLGGTVLLRLLVGAGYLEWPETGSILRLRGVRAAAGLIVGASLALSGLMLQSLLRNPLASPDLLGMASGAGLAVMVGVYIQSAVGASGGSLGAGAGLGGWQAGPALAGSLGALGLVYTLSQRRGLVDPATLVLVGVIISIVCGAGTVLVQHLVPAGDAGSRTLLRLLTGTLTDDTTAPQLGAAGAVLAAGLLGGTLAGPAMDAAALGEDEARSLGVRLGSLRLMLFVLAGALGAAAVVVAGPIGFVGLICPHAARLLAGPGAGHRALVLASALAGGALLVGADAAVKSVTLGGGRVPLGVVTALVGGPAFIALLRTGKGTG